MRPLHDVERAESGRRSDVAAATDHPCIARGRGLACHVPSLDGGLPLQFIHISMCMMQCMRTNIEIDDEVMREAQHLLGVGTKKEAVDMALRELVARHRRLGVLDLRGKVRWAGDLEESRRGRP